MGLVMLIEDEEFQKKDDEQDQLLKKLDEAIQRNKDEIEGLNRLINSIKKKLKEIDATDPADDSKETDKNSQED